MATNIGISKPKSSVLELANRATVQKLSAETLSGLTLRMNNHESGSNTHAHQISNIAGLLNILETDDTNLDTLQEIVDYIKANRAQVVANTQNVANLASASASFHASTNPIFSLTTSDQTLPFSVLEPSSNTSVFEMNDIANTITFYKAASYNFRTDMTFYSNTNASRTITITGKSILDNSIIYTRQVTLTFSNNSYITVSTNVVVTPNVPVEMYFTVRCDDTGIILQDFTSSVASTASASTLGAVDLETNQTINGVKTFNDLPIIVDGYTGSINVVTSVNFGSSSVTTSTINIQNGIITSIT